MTFILRFAMLKCMEAIVWGALHCLTTVVPVNKSVGHLEPWCRGACEQSSGDFELYCRGACKPSPLFFPCPYHGACKPLPLFCIFLPFRKDPRKF